MRKIDKVYTNKYKNKRDKTFNYLKRQIKKEIKLSYNPSYPKKHLLNKKIKKKKFYLIFNNKVTKNSFRNKK
jgi:hypothetical protein